MMNSVLMSLKNSMSTTKTLIVVVGPTAIGKTSYSIQLAKKLNTEIISADSRQFYKEMSIGTAVPNHQDLKQVKHHFIHNKSVIDNYNVGHFEKEAIQKISQLFKKHDSLILTGGSGLYIDAVCYGLNDFPIIDHEVRHKTRKEFEKNGLEWLKSELKKKDIEYYNNVDTKNPQRLLRALEVCNQTKKTYSHFINQEKPKRSFKLEFRGLKTSREKLYDKINHRVDNMINQGLVEEVKSLKEFQNLNPLQTVGYKEIFDFLDQKHSLDRAIELIKQNTRRYAKRQITWFKKYQMKWIDV